MEIDSPYNTSGNNSRRPDDDNEEKEILRGPVHRIEDDYDDYDEYNYEQKRWRRVVERHNFTSVCQYAEKYTRCVASDDIIRCVDGSLGGVYKTFRFDPNVHDPDLFILAQTQIRLANMYEGNKNTLELIYRMGNLNELWAGGFYIQYRTKRLRSGIIKASTEAATPSLNFVETSSTLQDVRDRIRETFTNPVRIARLIDFAEEMWRRGQEVRYRVSYDDFVLTLPMARRMYAKLNGIHIIPHE